MADMRSLLQLLTVPDTNTVKSATATIRSLLRTPSTLSTLLPLLSDPSPAIRQLSSIVLRRPLLAHWNNLSQQDRASAHAILLTAVRDDPSPPSLRAHIALLSSVARISHFPAAFALALTLSSAPSIRGHQLLASLLDTSPDGLLPRIEPLQAALRAGLSSSDQSICAAAVRAAEAAVSSAAITDPDALKPLAALLPDVARVTSSFASTPMVAASDDFGRVAADVFEIFVGIAESGGDAMKPYFNDSVALALEIFGHTRAARAARGAASEYALFTIRQKPRTLRRAGLAARAVEVALTVAQEDKSREDTEDISDDDDDGEPPSLNALRLLDALARRPELCEGVFRAAIAAIGSARPTPEAFRAFSAVADGCAVHVTAHAAEIIPRLAAGATDSSVSPRSRGTALEALGHACEALDTDEMQESVLASIAAPALNAVLAGMRDPELKMRRQACMSLEPVLTICLLEDGPLLPQRIQEIIGALGGLGVDAAAEAVAAVGVLIEQAADAFVESERIGDCVEGTLMIMGRSDEDAIEARAAAVETGGALVAVVKDQGIVERLAAAAAEALEAEDPGVKKAAFSFFAKMSDALGGKVAAAYGEKILTVAAQSMLRDDIMFEPQREGLGDGLDDLGKACGGNSKAENGDDIGDGNDEDDFGDDENGRGTFQVRTAYLDEKMLATLCCGAVAEACSTDEYVRIMESRPETARSIQQHLAEVADLIDKLSLYFHEDVRAASNRAGVRIAIASNWFTENHPALAFGDADTLPGTFRRLSYAIEEDDDVWVVTNVLKVAGVLCDELPVELLTQHKRALLAALELAIDGKTVCQTAGADEDTFDEILAAKDDHGEDQDESSDELSELLAGIGDLIEGFARSLRGYFAPDFLKLLPKIMKQLYRPSSSPRNKGTVLGAIAGVLLFMNWERCDRFDPPSVGSSEYNFALSALDTVCATILPHALEALGAKSGKNLQRNAVFLIGVIFSKAQSSNTAVWGRLTQTVQHLQELLLLDAKNDNGVLIDNAAGAVARIMTSPGLKSGALGNPRNALQLLMGVIPMEFDPTENTTVARAILHFAEHDFSILVQFIEPVVSCLTTAALLVIEQSKQENQRRSATREEDENDRMARLTSEESTKLAQVLSQIRSQFGDSPFNNLRLSHEDAAALATVITR